MWHRQLRTATSRWLYGPCRIPQVLPLLNAPSRLLHMDLEEECDCLDVLRRPRKECSSQSCFYVTTPVEESVGSPRVKPSEHEQGSLLQCEKLEESCPSDGMQHDATTEEDRASAVVLRRGDSDEYHNFSSGLKKQDNVDSFLKWSVDGHASQLSTPPGDTSRISLPQVELVGTKDHNALGQFQLGDQSELRPTRGGEDLAYNFQVDDQTMRQKSWCQRFISLPVQPIFVILALSIIALPQNCSAGFEGQAVLPWRHYYRVINQYGSSKGGRPERVRVGQGRYRMTLQGAELLCDFPSTSVLVSNVVWERADLGALRDLDQLYKSVGQSRVYSVTTRPNGSTLNLANVTPVDQGLYRCMATAIDPSTNAMYTLFQDIPFYPDFGAYRSRQEPYVHRPSCCRFKDSLRGYPSISTPTASTIAILPPLHHHHHHQYQHHHQSTSLVVNGLSQY